MTDDYKDTLLRYFTGNLKDEPVPQNIPLFQEQQKTDSTIYTYIYNNIGSGFTELGILQGYNSTYSVIYGNDSTNKGFMVILDETNTPVQFINEYSSGTAFGTFQILNVAEDGNFYGIDINNGTPRFIMLNNVVLVLPNQEEFSVKLRQSYNLPSPLSTATSYFAITKAVGQGKYVIGATYLSLLNKQSPLVTELTINVGATNDWVNYNLDLTTWDFIGNSIWSSWDNDNLDFSISGYCDQGDGIYFVIFEKDDNSQTNLLIESYSHIAIEGYSNGYYNINSMLLNKDNAYIGLYDGGEYGTSEINQICYYNGDWIDILESFQKGTTMALTGIDRKIRFKNVNGNVYFMCKCYEQYSSVNDLYIYTGIIEKKPSMYYPNLYYTTIFIDDGTTWRYDFLVSNIYNLYTYNILSLDFDKNTSVGSNVTIKQIYNINNYNGVPYEKPYSLIAHTGEIFDSNNNLIFARNLYNNVVTNNTTMSILQIPNTLLNDITLSSQYLLGETNKILATNQEDLVKNIYETVYYNFYNTLMIEDRNTPIYKQNMTGAERINNSTSITADYNQAKATKYRLNYSDDTNLILPIQPTIQEEDSISGNNSLYITNAEEQENIISYSVDGATEQNGTPTPDNPVEVKTIPSIMNMFNPVVVNEGTNIYTSNCTASVNNGVITLTATANGTLNFGSGRSSGGNYAKDRGIKIYVKPNTTYQISLSNKTFNRVYINSYDSSNVSLGGSSTYLPNTSFTTSSTVSYITITLIYTNAVSGNSYSTTVQLEEGSTPHEYVPYGYWSKVKVTGKNICPTDFSNWESGDYSGKGAKSDNTARIRLKQLLRVNPSTTYYLNVFSSNDRFGLRTYDSSMNFVRSIGGVANESTITTNNNEYYLGIFIYSNTNQSRSYETYQTMFSNGDIKPLICLNSETDKSYEPYKENQVLIDMSKENLISTNENGWSQGTFNQGVETSSTIRIRNNDFIPMVKSSYSYTLEDTNYVYQAIICYKNDYTYLSEISGISGKTSGTFNVPTNCSYVRIVMKKSNNGTILPSEIATIKPKFYEGSITPYYELCGIGDYKDILSVDSSGNVSISKNIGKVVLNGSESWSQASSQYTGLYSVAIQKSDMLTTTSTDSVMSNYFNKQLYNSQTQGITKNANNNYIVIRIDNTIANSVSTFKTWLSTHNTDVYYELATPETINLPNTKIPLFEGINHVTFVDTLNTNTYLTYDIPNLATYTFDIYVPTDRTIDSLDILSNDENTIYHTIDTSSLENNKFYKITQACHIE